MNEPTARQKGDTLENTVREIESTILHTAPGFSEGTFRIQSKRIVVSDGVRHEIDLYVTAALPTGYEAIFVFECKNWQDKVGKNDIIVFSEKVKATNAQRGFFVAKSFTKDAVAQAEKDPRLELLTAAELDPSSVLVPPNLISTHIITGSVNVVFGGSAAQASPLSRRTCPMRRSLWMGFQL
jgi:Restriction endonuclease